MSLDNVLPMSLEDFVTYVPERFNIRLSKRELGPNRAEPSICPPYLKSEKLPAPPASPPGLFSQPGGGRSTRA